MTRNDKARKAADEVLFKLYLREPGQAQQIQIPDYGEVQWAADGRAYVEALIEVPAEMLLEGGKDA